VTHSKVLKKSWGPIWALGSLELTIANWFASGTLYNIGICEFHMVDYGSYFGRWLGFELLSRLLLISFSRSTVLYGWLAPLLRHLIVKELESSSVLLLWYFHNQYITDSPHDVCRLLPLTQWCWIISFGMLCQECHQDYQCVTGWRI